MTQTAAERAFDMFKNAFPNAEAATVEELRRQDDEFWGSMVPTDAIVEPVDASGVPALWASVPGVAHDRIMIWFHGGGYLLGSATGWRGIAAEISRAADCRVLVPDFRLAPEHTFPAALEDATNAYRFALDLVGASSVAIGGASGGGNLTLAGLLAIRANNLPLPGAAIAVSPWTDMTLSSETFERNKDVDPFVSKEMCERLRENYLVDHDPTDPLASPLYGDLSGLPPLLLMVGTAETLLDDTRNFAKAAENAGTDVELCIYKDMFHLWFMFPTFVPEARDAVDHIGAYVRSNTLRS